MKLKENFMYVCFHKGKGIVGKAISLWTLGEYAHVEFVYNGKKYLANPGGVRSEDYKYEKNHDLYELSFLVDFEKILQFFKATEGLKYDYKGIVNAQFLMKDNRDTAHNKNEYFCSEWALHAIDYATDYRLMYKDEALNQKGYYKFNPQRMYKYLKEQQLIDRKVENNE